MMENASVNSQNNVLEEPLAPKRTRLEEFWRLFRKNKLAIAGMVFFILFFALAIVGFGLTRGSAPILDPALVRLQDKLRPPLALPNLERLQPHDIPKLGIYIFGVHTYSP